MNMMQWKEENCGANEMKGANCTSGGFVNKNFRVTEEQEATMDGNNFLFGCPLEEKGVMEMEEEAPAVQKKKMEVLENKMASHQLVVAQHARRFWTKEEHSQWNNISKYLVMTRTLVQVSSHVQKYFKRLESRGSGRKRYSINEVGLHDADPWTAENSPDAQQVLAFGGTNERNPRLDLQGPASPFIIMKNNAQF